MTASAPSGWRPSFEAACQRQSVSPSHRLGGKRGLFYCLPYPFLFFISPRVSSCSSLVAPVLHSIDRAVGRLAAQRCWRFCHITRSTTLRCAAGFVLRFCTAAKGTIRSMRYVCSWN